MPGAKTWVLKPRTFALSTLLYEHAKSVHFNSLWNKFVNESNFDFHNPTPHTTYILLIVAIKAKCLEFHCSTPDWNETSERIVDVIYPSWSLISILPASGIVNSCKQLLSKSEKWFVHTHWVQEGLVLLEALCVSLCEVCFVYWKEWVSIPKI